MAMLVASAEVPGTDTLTSIYQTPVSKRTVGNLTISPATATVTEVSIARIDGLVGDVSSEDYALMGGPVSGLSTQTLQAFNAPIRRNSVVLPEGYTLAVRSSAVALAVQFEYLEEDTA